MSASSHPLKTDIFTTTKNGLHPSISYCYRTRKSRFWYVSDKSLVIYRLFSEICGTGHEYSILCNLQRHYKREHNLSVVEYESLIQNQTELMAYRKKYGYTGYDHTCLFCGMDLLQFRRNNKRIGRQVFKSITEESTLSIVLTVGFFGQVICLDFTLTSRTSDTGKTVWLSLILSNICTGLLSRG